jgi:predicted dienelactone hydrolase
MLDVFGVAGKLDTSKIILAGHSFGGNTALRIGEQDKRIKTILTLDPWIYPLGIKKFTNI